MVLLTILVCFLIFGRVMDSLPMIPLTSPIFSPLIESLGFLPDGWADSDLLRHPGPDFGRGRSDHAFGWDEPFKYQQHGQRRTHGAHLSRQHGVCHFRFGPRGFSGDLSGPHTVVAWGNVLAERVNSGRVGLRKKVRLSAIFR